MANTSSEKVKEPLAASKPANLVTAVNPLDEPAQNDQQAALGEAAVETQPLKSPAAAAPAKEPVHLLTPLAALWPTATPPEPPKTPQTTVKPTVPPMVKVTFVLHEPDAKQVALSGEFNAWSPDATPMKRNDSGLWETTVALTPGRHEYKYVVDGRWKHDPQARVNVWNEQGTLNSVAQVRA